MGLTPFQGIIRQLTAPIVQGLVSIVAHYTDMGHIKFRVRIFFTGLTYDQAHTHC